MGVLFGCGQGVVFVPEIDSGKLAPMCLELIHLYSGELILAFLSQKVKINIDTIFIILSL